MAVTTLDPQTALVVIDLQKGIVALPTVHPVDKVIEHAAALADAFRRHGLPVVLVNVTGDAPGRTEQPRPRVDSTDDWTELVPALDRQPQDRASPCSQRKERLTMAWTDGLGYPGNPGAFRRRRNSIAHNAHNVSASLMQ